jgi:hypothetical protein
MKAPTIYETHPTLGAALEAMFGKNPSIQQILSRGLELPGVVQQTTIDITKHEKETQEKYEQGFLAGHKETTEYIKELALRCETIKEFREAMIVLEEKSKNHQ